LKSSAGSRHWFIASRHRPTKKALVEQLVHRQHLQGAARDPRPSACGRYRLHPRSAAIDDRLVVWDCVKADRDGEILIEVNDAVRETLIASMNRDELVDAVESLKPTRSRRSRTTCPRMSSTKSGRG
jgi:magnesium transporter